ncbi:lin0512 family protein [Nitzschia inconspicua]|uniref:Lin0512 family protein n=1 Tax=Nitzschia inconspicua TaxID=303405 RepID=A0A9K3KU44_9STRA|nr:lin0512 family protein [Nitzschia inconspicua]
MTMKILQRQIKIRRRILVETRSSSVPAIQTFSHRPYHKLPVTHQPSSSWKDLQVGDIERPTWNDEWKRLGLGAKLVDDMSFPSNLFFVQLGFGVDQHGDKSNATKACVRAVRNAIEFNSIPGVIQHIPGGRHAMLIHVKLGVPKGATVDRLQVAKVFPYGRLLPIQVEVGGLEFHSGRVVEELGDDDDVGICCVACVSIGYSDDDDESKQTSHKTFSTKDGY